MKRRINICVHTHKDGAVCVDIGIPVDLLDKECKIEARVNNKAKNHKETDRGYETDQMEKHWCDGEDEDRIYDNLD